MIRRPPRSTLFSLHDALPIFACGSGRLTMALHRLAPEGLVVGLDFSARMRSEEHTSELQSQSNLVCRLLLEKKKTHTHYRHPALRSSPLYYRSESRHVIRACS